MANYALKHQYTGLVCRDQSVHLREGASTSGSRCVFSCCLVSQLILSYSGQVMNLESARYIFSLLVVTEILTCNRLGPKITLVRKDLSLERSWHIRSPSR